MCDYDDGGATKTRTKKNFCSNGMNRICLKTRTTTKRTCGPNFWDPVQSGGD